MLPYVSGTKHMRNVSRHSLHHLSARSKKWRGQGKAGGGGGGHAWVDIVKSNLPKFFSIRKVEESINNS